MKKINKVLSLLLFAIMMVSMTSCGSKKIELTKAIENTAKVKSYKFKTNVQVGIDGVGIDQQTKEMIEDLNLSIEGMVKKNSVNEVQSKSDIKFSFQGVSMELETFLDLAFNDEDFKYNIYLEIPKILKEDLMLGQLVMGKKYAFLGINKETLQENADLTGDAVSESYLKEELSKNVVQDFNEVFGDFYKKNKKEISKFIEEMEVEINDELLKLPAYEVTITDELLKKYLKEYLENDKNIDNLVKAIKESEDISEDEIRKNLKESAEEIENLPLIIGEDGIKMTYVIKDKMVAKVIYDLTIDAEGNSLSLKIEHENFDINKDFNIDIPDEKSDEVLDLLDLSKMFR